MQPVPLLRLPPGAITPRGWLAQQLQLDAGGLPGRMQQISDYLNTSNNGWVVAGGTGGWEELVYWLRGYGDLGYVLNNPAIIGDAVTNWLKPMMATQVATGTNAGAFGPSPIYTAAAGSIDIWPLMPACEALQHYYSFTNDPAVIPFLTNYFTWLNTHQYAIGPGWANTRWADHLDTIYWLYNLTGQAFLLSLATNIHNTCGQQWLTVLPGWHNVNLSQGFREPGEYSMQSGNAAHLQASETDYHRFMDPFGQYPGGGWSGDENARGGYRDPRQGFETCGHVELMKSCEILARISGNPVWADRCEDIAFNRLPTTTALDHSGVCYVSAANAIQIDNVSKLHNQFGNGTMKMLALMPGVHQYRCCTHNYTMGWPYFAEELWLATLDAGLCASLYAPSQVRAKVASGATVTITEATDYPFGDTINLTLTSTNSAPLSFPLYLRVPRWCATNQPVLNINGVQTAVAATPLAYLKIQRAWSNGDTVTCQWPMQVGVTTWATNKNAVSVNYGPLEFALGIQEVWSTLPVSNPSSTDFNNTWLGYQVLPGSAWNYGLALDAGNPTNGLWVTRSAGALPANPFLPTNVPITLSVPARRIIGWNADVDNLVAQLQASPVRSTQAVENLMLVPMGAAHLRISAFPTIGTGTNAHDWVATPPFWAATSASYVHDDITALNDGIEAAASSDASIPRFTWYNHQGTTEWAEYDYPQRVQISSAAVYWYDDGGGVRLPVSWQVLWQDPLGNWLAVSNASAYAVADNVYNRVAFAPVITRSLRVQAQLSASASAGILEWQAPIDATNVPAVNITNPADGSVILPGANVVLAAGVSGFSAPVAKVDFYVNGSLAGSDSASPYQTSWPASLPGAWKVWAVATDTNGLAVISDPVTLTVYPSNSLITAGSLYVDLRPRDLAGSAATWTNRTGLGDFVSDGVDAPVFTTNAGLAAVLLDGNAGYKGPNTTAAWLSGSAVRSVEVWVNNPGLADEETMVALGQRGVNNHNFAFNFGSDANWGALAMWADDIGWNGSPAANAWHYLVATYDGSVARVYADGVLKNSLVNTLSTPVGPIWIGSQTADGVNPSVGWFSGYLGAIRVHTGVLSSNAVAINYALGATATPMPSVPAGLVAASGLNQAALTWMPSFNATAYHVKRANVTGGPYTLVATTATTNYTDTGLLGGAGYYYVVSALLGADESANSPEVVAVPAPAQNLFRDDFNDGNANGWTTYGGTWSVTNGQWSATVYPGAKAVANGTAFSNLVYEADVSIGASGDAGVIFRASNPTVGADTYNGYYAGVSSAQKVVLGRANGAWTQLATTAMSIASNTPYHLKVAAIGSSLSVYVGDLTTPKISVTDTTWQTGGIGVRTYNAAAAFDNIWVLAAALTPPTNLTATASNAAVALNWGGSLAATSYNVKRLNLLPVPATNTIANTTFLTYTDTGLANEVVVAYVVTALNANGETVPSAQVSATPHALPVITGSLVGAGNQVCLTWPGWASNFLPYAATNLTPVVTWSLVTNPVVSSNGQCYLFLPATNSGARFFRLGR